MSDLAFGESLNMLQNNKYHFALDLLQNGMDILGPLSPVEWLVRIGYSIPRVAQHFKDLIAWSGKRLEKRMQVWINIMNGEKEFELILVPNSRTMCKDVM